MPAALRPHPHQPRPRGPVVVVVMDGVGRGAGDEADAVAIAATPTLDRLWVPGVRAELRAHGKAVGLPSDDDMGNSEVGHNTLGAGKVYAQGAKLVNAAIATGAMFAAAARAGCRRLYVHALLDGRDVPPTSALEYIDRIERFLATLRGSGIE